jgi:hypothetical protein
MRTSVVAGSVLGCLALAAGAVLGGFVPIPGLGGSMTHPPCQSLPTSDRVAAAIASHQPVTEAIQTLVDGATVSIKHPCDGAFADRALVRVAVPDAKARQRLLAWLGTHDGYGVPLEVEVSRGGTSGSGPA